MSSKSRRSVVFAEPVRCAIGAFGAALKDIPAPDLGAAVIKAADTGLLADDAVDKVLDNKIRSICRGCF
jgi:acetyl-CoA C-acetyltransferase